MRTFAQTINKRKEARVKLVEMAGKLIGYPVSSTPYSAFLALTGLTSWVFLLTMLLARR